jgi:hypothetical protein
MRTIKVLPVRSGENSTILKLIKLIARLQLVTSPVSRGGNGVGEIVAVREVCTVGERTAVGEAGAVGAMLVGSFVAVGWIVPAQSRPFNSSFEAAYNGEETENFPAITGCLIVPSGHI